MNNIDMDKLKEAVKANNAFLDKLRNDPKVIDLGEKMQKVAFNLDKAGIKAGKEDYWSDMAVIAAYCLAAQYAEVMRGRKFDPPAPAANDNVNETKLAA